jgi:hypothetical protein
MATDATDATYRGEGCGMSESPRRRWTIDQGIEDQQRQGKMAPPFTTTDRDLALGVAEARYGSEELTETCPRAAWESRPSGPMYRGVSGARPPRINITGS